MLKHIWRLLNTLEHIWRPFAVSGNLVPWSFPYFAVSVPENLQILPLYPTLMLFAYCAVCIYMCLCTMQIYMFEKRFYLVLSCWPIPYYTVSASLTFAAPHSALSTLISCVLTTSCQRRLHKRCSRVDTKMS